MTPRPTVNATTVEAAAWAGSPPGFRTRYRELAPLPGGELLVGSVYEFDPGERNGPYHTAIPLAATFLLRSERAERGAGLAVVLTILASAITAGCSRSCPSSTPSPFNTCSRLGSRARSV